MYIHEQKNWPDFTWDQSRLADDLAAARHLQGKLLGRMTTLGFPLQDEATLQTLSQDVIKTSEIEGQKLDLEQVRSSLARRLGLDTGGMVPAGRDVEGIVDMLFDATQHYERPLSEARLFDWHAALFPTGRSGMHRIAVGAWRHAASRPMQVVSGPAGREKVHFEAPGCERLPAEMARFIAWFNQDEKMDLIMRAALAHFWFVTVHPFDDGNGRIARALADMMAARSEKSPKRFYSMSSQIQRERSAYYEILERTQKGGLDITLWFEWFLGCFKRAVASSETMLETVLMKAHFWSTHAGASLNERQRGIVCLLLDDFKGNLTSSKYAKISKCSQDTALRDIADLVALNILIKEEAGGRSTSYRLK